MSDQNKGPEILILRAKNLHPAVDGLIDTLGAYLALSDAIERGGCDVSPCLICQELVVCIPGGIPMCLKCVEKCAEKAGC